MFFAFLFRKAQHKVPPCIYVNFLLLQKQKCFVFLQFFFLVHGWEKKPCRSERAETRDSDKMFHDFFDVFFLEKNFLHFFIFVFWGLATWPTGVCHYLVGCVFTQALPDLWSPRVWFTFRYFGGNLGQRFWGSYRVPVYKESLLL